MKKRAILGFFILLVILIFFGCDLGGDSASIDSEEAKSLYLAASEALYDEVDPLGENSEKALSYKSLPRAPTALPSITTNGVQLTGTIDADVNSTMPSTFTDDTSGTFTNSVKITFDIKGTMNEVTVQDPEDSTKKYTVSGTIEHYIKMDMSMTITMAAQSHAITPGGTLDLEMRHTSMLTVSRNDGTKAKFKISFEDKQTQISLGNIGSGTLEQRPNGANAYQKTAKLYTYDENDTLITEADISIMDIPWMMGNLMGGGSPNGGTLGGDGG